MSDAARPPDAAASGGTRALAVLVCGASAIAFGPIFVRWTGTGAAAAGFWRLGLAIPALAVLTALNRGPGAAGPIRRPTPLALLAGLFFALDIGFWHYGIRFTTVANATILANLSPVFVVGGAWLLLKERPGRGFLAGMALALVGTWALAEGSVGRRGLDPALGDGLSVITAVWYAAYLLTVRRARASQTASEVMFWSSAVGAPLLLAAALALHERVLPTTVLGWEACVGLGAMHVIGQGAIAWALGRLPAATASVVILAQPVLAAALGWLIFAEALGAPQIAGGVAALSGVVLAQLAARRREMT